MANVFFCAIPLDTTLYTRKKLYCKERLSNLLCHVSDNGQTFWLIPVRTQVLNNGWLGHATDYFGHTKIRRPECKWTYSSAGQRIQVIDINLYWTKTFYKNIEKTDHITIASPTFKYKKSRKKLKKQAVGHVSNESKVWFFYFSYNSNQLLPLRVSSGKTYPFLLDLLLLSNGQIYHYVLILNLLILFAKIKGKENRDGNHLRQNCLHICSSAELLTIHQTTCLQKNSVQITLLEPSKNNLKFENYATRWFSPFVIYLDLEALIVPISTAKNNPSVSGTVEKHEPCSNCLIVIEQEPVHFDVYTEPNCMTRGDAIINEIGKTSTLLLLSEKGVSGFHWFSSSQKRLLLLFDLQCSFRWWKSLGPLSFHWKFVWYAHNECNLNVEPSITLIARNMMKYDLHHTVKAIHTASRTTTFDVIQMMRSSLSWTSAYSSKGGKGGCPWISTFH